MKLRGVVVLICLLTTLNVLAKDIHVGTKRKRVCIGAKEKLFQSRVQFDVLAINGRSSRQSTFWYNGGHSRLELDFHTANVHATCNSRGTDRYNFTYSPAYNDPNNYLLTMFVDCVPCPKTGASVIQVKAKTKKIRKNIMILERIHNNPQGKKLKQKVLKEMKEVLMLIEKLLRSEILIEREMLDL